LRRRGGAGQRKRPVRRRLRGVARTTALPRGTLRTDFAVVDATVTTVDRDTTAERRAFDRCVAGSARSEPLRVLRRVAAGRTGSD
jgi:hypothetical protein